jgi:uncharacterized protein YjbI with pentapeptide repeats
MSDQQPRRPTTDFKDDWKAYWTALGMPWRTEPEIDTERQGFLAEQRAAQPSYQRDVYPFSGRHLGRADIEWLLATHEHGGVRGPVMGSMFVAEVADPPNLSGIDLHGVALVLLARELSGQWEEAPIGAETGPNEPPVMPGQDEPSLVRWGLDLRGADLHDAHLRTLPLEGLWGGQRGDWWQGASADEREAAAVRLERADLRSALLQGSSLRHANLRRAALQAASLQCADLREANFEGADLTQAHCACADFFRATLLGACLSASYVSRAEFRNANLSQADLSRAIAWGAGMRGAHLEQANLQGADLRCADLTGALLMGADLRDADLRGAHMTRVNLDGANLQGANLTDVVGL